MPGKNKIDGREPGRLTGVGRPNGRIHNPNACVAPTHAFGVVLITHNQIGIDAVVEQVAAVSERNLPAETHFDV
jgi:hypothetical protein